MTFSSGNVGIGTTSPSARLDIRSLASSGATNAPTFRAFGSDTDSYFEVNNNANNSADIKLTRSDAATMFKIDGHSGVTYFAGDVGIGTTTPNAKLHISANALGTSAGDFVYLLEMVINSSQYAVQINNYLISTAIATANTWTLPASPTWALPTNSILPYITIPADNDFGLLIGYEAGQYPAGTITGSPPSQVQTPAFTSAQSELSQLAPQITPYSSVLVFCSLVNNTAVIPSQLLFSFTPTDAGFGALQNFKTYEFAWNRCSDGSYAQFTIEFRDQLGRALVFEDPNTLITLVLKNRDDDY
jgi:hypothetical protein